MTRILICGAGIAGISAAYHLTHQRAGEVILLDERPPLTLTSNHSTECYRAWWPGNAPMQALAEHAITGLEALARHSGNRFHLNRRGYLYLTANPQQAQRLKQQALARAAAGENLRIHRAEDDHWQLSPADWQTAPAGLDLLWGAEVLKRRFSGLSDDILAGLHVRRAGWLSAQQLGRMLLEEARQRGLREYRARLVAVETQGGRVRAIRLADGSRLATDILVNAAGPFFAPVGQMAGLDLPVYTELHLKNAFRDDRHILPRNAPLLIWQDAQHLPWDEAERAELAADPNLRWLLAALPGGVHTRPEGGEHSPIALHLWEYRTRRLPPRFPLPEDDLYPEIVLRGLSRMLPGLQAYFHSPPRPQMDGGYYTRTAENLPLIGPTPLPGFYLLGALSGYGIMTAWGAGELLTRAILGQAQPDFAQWFTLARYDDPQKRVALQKLEDGQL